MTRHKTAKGKTLDMEAIRASNERAVALGNMSVNARGDRLGRGGKIEETAPERVRAYNTNNPKAVRQVSLKSPLDTAGLEENTLNEPVKKKPVKKTTAKAKTKEVELPDGSIEIVEDTDD